MKRLATALLVLGALWLPVAAEAYTEHPTITEREAFRAVQHLLHERYWWSWKDRDWGEIDCRPGRVNRYSWSCGVIWSHNGICRQGRARVVNLYAEDGEIYSNTLFNGRYC